MCERYSITSFAHPITINSLNSLLNLQLNSGTVEEWKGLNEYLKIMGHKDFYFNIHACVCVCMHGS